MLRKNAEEETVKVKQRKVEKRLLGDKGNEGVTRKDGMKEG